MFTPVFATHQQCLPLALFCEGGCGCFEEAGVLMGFAAEETLRLLTVLFVLALLLALYFYVAMRGLVRAEL